MAWINPDGLRVKFGKEEGGLARGGEVSDAQRHEVEYVVDWTDLLSATDSILGSVGTLTPVGTAGVVVPKGARIERLETIVITAFTSSGTIGSSTLLMGLIKTSDYVTELDFNGFTTASFVGSLFDAAGETQAVIPGSTGAGALIGTTLAESGVISVSNSAHASHPYTAGKLKVKLWYSLPQVTS
jgi:hypothetical protein